MSDNDELEIIEEEDIPENAQILQCRVVVGDDGVLSRLPEADQPDLQDGGGE